MGTLIIEKKELPSNTPTHMIRKVREDAKKHAIREKLNKRDPHIPILTMPNFLINIPVITPKRNKKLKSIHILHW